MWLYGFKNYLCKIASNPVLTTIKIKLPHPIYFRTNRQAHVHMSYRFFLLQLEFELDCLLSGRICCDPFVGNCSDREIHVCSQEFVQDNRLRHWQQNAPSVNGHYECPHFTFLCPSPIGK